MSNISQHCPACLPPRRQGEACVSKQQSQSKWEEETRCLYVTFFSILQQSLFNEHWVWQPRHCFLFQRIFFHWSMMGGRVGQPYQTINETSSNGDRRFVGSMQRSFEKAEVRDSSQFQCLEVLRFVNSGRWIVCSYVIMMVIMITITMSSAWSSSLSASPSATASSLSKKVKLLMRDDESNPELVSLQNAPLAIKSIIFLVPACWILPLKRTEATSASKTLHSHG